MSPRCLSCKGSKWAFKQFFLKSRNSAWYALAVTFPSFKSFLHRCLFLFWFSPGSYKAILYFLTSKVLYLTYPSSCVNFYCFSIHHFHLFLIFHTPAIYPIYTHFLFQPVDKLLYDERERKREFDILGRASSRSSLAPEPGASGIMPALGYPGHQNRVSIKAPRRRER